MGSGELKGRERTYWQGNTVTWEEIELTRGRSRGLGAVVVEEDIRACKILAAHRSCSAANVM